MYTTRTFRKSLLSSALAAILAGGVAGTVQAEDEMMREELQRLQERVAELEAAQPEEPAEMGGNWSDAVSVSGYVAIDTYYEDYADENYSDIYISEAWLSIDAEVAEDVTAGMVFYYEDGYDNPDLDEATISYNPDGGPLTFTAGRTYLPFGVYESNMVSDPLTLELGEIREDMLMVGMDNGGLYGGAYVFNGDINEDGSDDVIENFGLNLGYYWEQGSSSFDVGVDWINSIYDTDGVEWALNELYGVDTVVERVEGLAVHANGRYGPLSVYSEYVTALDELAGGNTSTSASAWAVEAGYDFLLGGMDSTVALGYQETSEAAILDLYEERVIGALSMEVMNNTTLAFEYKRDTDYDGEDSNAGTAQVAVEF